MAEQNTPYKYVSTSLHEHGFEVQAAHYELMGLFSNS